MESRLGVAGETKGGVGEEGSMVGEGCEVEIRCMRSGVWEKVEIREKGGVNRGSGGGSVEEGRAGNGG